MKSILSKSLDSKLVRYIFIGGISFLIEMLVIAIMTLTNFGPTFTVGVSFWIGLLTSFVLQKIIAFQDTRHDKKTLSAQIFFYTLLVIINYVFTLVFVTLTVGIIGVYIARTIALIITTIWNFFIYSKVIFRHE